MERKFQGTKVPWNFRSRERKFFGTKVPAFVKPTLLRDKQRYIYSEYAYIHMLVFLFISAFFSGIY